MTKEHFDQLVHSVAIKPDDPETLKALEPYRAKRAIFLAAGFGTRLLPLTLETPKPLVKVNGKRIIDASIDACLAAGIEEIYIVRGYLAEQFDVLLKKYPMVKFLENPGYAETNNISSAMAACHLFENAYVLEADLLVQNPNVIRKYHYQSDVLGIWMEHSDDWVLYPDADGNVAEETSGGDHCYQMVGIYYWNAADARKLYHHIQKVFTEVPGGFNRYWETVPNQSYRGEYKIQIIPCAATDVIEIDTLTELKAIDPSYC